MLIIHDVETKLLSRRVQRWNKFTLNLPFLVPEANEKQKLVSSTKGKAKVVGDIHIQIKDLKNVGADLCRTLFMYFNESIKLRKLQSLRKISKQSPESFI